MAEGGTPVLGPHDEFFDHTCTRCKDRKRNVEALCYCQSCDKYFCSSCRDDHSESQRDHVVLETSERSRWGILQETELGEQNRRIADIQTRRLILVGRCGNGKSSTGNTILGDYLFEAKTGMMSTTKTCEQKVRLRRDDQRKYMVVDTPGLFDTDQPFAKTALEIQRALEICLEPHAFLIILRLDSRYTEEEQLTIDMLRVIFGEGCLKHAILVFTRGDSMTDQNFNREIEKHVILKKLKEECGDRVARVENRTPVNENTGDKLTSNVLNMIEQASDNGTKSYVYASLDIHRNCLMQQLKNRKPNAKLGEELNELVKQLGSRLGRERWRSYLIGGTVGTVGTVVTRAAAIGIRDMSVPVDVATTGVVETAQDALVSVPTDVATTEIIETAQDAITTHIIPDTAANEVTTGVSAVQDALQDGNLNLALGGILLPIAICLVLAAAVKSAENK